MGWHVVRSFRRMGECRVAIGSDSGHERFQISHNIGVCILTQHERGTGVTDKYVTHPRFNTRRRYYLLYIGAQVIGATSRRLHPQFLTSDQSAPAGT